MSIKVIVTFFIFHSVHHFTCFSASYDIFVLPFECNTNAYIKVHTRVEF